MKHLFYPLIALLVIGCSTFRTGKTTQELPLGKWTFKEAIISEKKKKKSDLEDIKGKEIEFRADRTLVISENDQPIYTGKWRVADIGFSTVSNDSAGIKTHAAYGSVLSVFTNKDLTILGEVTFSKNAMVIYEREKNLNRKYVLERVNQ